MLRPKNPLTHITRKGVVGTRTEHGVKHHLTRHVLTSTEATGGMPVTGPARTALDLAREHGHVAGVVACDAVLRRGSSLQELESELLVMWSWPNVTQAKAAIALADAGAESPGETLTRLVVLELGIGEPRTQFPVRIGDQVAWVDLLVGCHAIEFDGRVKVRPVADGGVATRSAEDVLWAERRRQHLVCAEGLGMSRVSWDDLFGKARDELKGRLRSEYALTLARFGDRLPPHLEEFARRTRRARRTA